MEFGLAIQGYAPAGKAHDRDAEHEVFRSEIELARLADRSNWKYLWLPEHHALAEYSHISDCESWAGFMAAATDRIHVGSGIINLSPRVNHPVRVAERVATLDHLSERRFEFGTGRGAGSYEVGTFGIGTTDSTRDEWDEVIAELPKMWRTTDYAYEGRHFSVPKRNILPKPMGRAHPPLWVAAGNPPTFAKAGRLGIGVLGFNFSSIFDMQPHVDAYKKAVEQAEPVGDYVNNNVMLSNGLICMEDGDEAREIATRSNMGYLYTLVCLYHDTFPRNERAPVWPEPPHRRSPRTIERAIEAGLMLCGSPSEIIEQLRSYERTGVDQIAFGFPGDLRFDEAVETIRLFGEQVIPHFDKDPVHSTSRMRDMA